MNCSTCFKSVTEVALFRTTAHGQPPKWKCAACITEDDRRQIAANETARKCRALRADSIGSDLCNP